MDQGSFSLTLLKLPVGVEYVFRHLVVSESLPNFELESLMLFVFNYLDPLLRHHIELEG